MSLTELFPATEDGNVFVELIIPQLTYVNDTDVGTRTHYGIKSISIGNLFRQTFGREVKSNETVVCKFQPINYRGAFKSHFTNPNAGGGEASFLLGDGWNGNFPKAMVLDIPAGCKIYGGPSRPYDIIYNKNNAITSMVFKYGQSRAPALFSLRGTDAFISQTSPLKLVGSGALYQSGGIGAGRSYSFQVGGVIGGNYSSGYQRGYVRGGTGMSYPSLVGGTYTMPPSEHVPDLWEPTFIVADVIPTMPRSPGAAVIVERMRDSSSQTEWAKLFTGGTGGRWGRGGTDGYYTERSAPYPANVMGTHPGLLFELGDQGPLRFATVGALEDALDFTEYNGNVNGYTKAEWNTPYTGSLRQTMNWYGNGLAFKTTMLLGASASVRNWGPPLGNPEGHQPIRN